MKKNSYLINQLKKPGSITNLLILTCIVVFFGQRIYFKIPFTSTLSLDQALMTGGHLTGTFNYTLLTSIFTHYNMTHLISNMIFLYIFGHYVEAKENGSLRGKMIYLAVYLIGGLFVTTVSSLLTPNTVTMGASGAIFIIIGIFTSDCWKRLMSVLRSTEKVELLSSDNIDLWINLIMIVITLVSTFAGITNMHVDSTVHILGFVLGVLIAWLQPKLSFHKKVD